MELNNYNHILHAGLERIKHQVQTSSEIISIIRLLNQMNLKGYLIGGIVRDLILNRPTKDIDLAINTNPERFLKILGQRIKGWVICLDQEYLTFRLITKDRRTFDFSPLRGDSIEQDLLKRDFTINAMAISLAELFDQGRSPYLIDPLEGIKDLAEQQIRAVSDQIFLDDPLRLLRAYRLAGQLNFKVEEHTQFLIDQDKKLLLRSAPERIREELFLLLSLDDSSPYITMLHQHNLLSLILAPKSQSESEVFKISDYHWEMSLRVLAYLEDILADLPAYLANSGQGLEHLLSQTAGHQTRFRAVLKLGALAYVFVLTNIFDQIDDLLKALCLTSSQQRYILLCLQGCHKPIELLTEKNCTPKYFYRFFRDLGEAGCSSLLLALAVQKAIYHQCPQPPSWFITELSNLLDQMATFYFQWHVQTDKPSILNGHTLIKHFNLSPGPIIGQLIDLLAEARVEGKITTKDEAINLVEQFLKTCKEPEAGHPDGGKPASLK